jgi:hypothetical protein
VTAAPFVIIAVCTLVLWFWGSRVVLLLSRNESKMAEVLSRDSKLSRTFWENVYADFLGPQILWI